MIRYKSLLRGVEQAIDRDDCAARLRRWRSQREMFKVERETATIDGYTARCYHKYSVASDAYTGVSIVISL